MNQKTQERNKRTKMLSEQLDKEIQRANSQNVQSKTSDINSMTPFDLLEQKLRRLQEKLQKVKESDSRLIYKQRKNSSSNNSKISTNRIHHHDKNSHFDYNSNTKSKKPQVQRKYLQKSKDKKISFTGQKDEILESQFTKNSRRKIFKSEKKHIESGQQVKFKKERIMSAKIESNKSSKLNSKMNTPQKKKRVVLSAKNKKSRNYQSVDKLSIGQNKNITHDQMSIKRKSSNKKVQSSSKKGNFALDSEYESGYKMLSKNINNRFSETNLKKKSLTSMSQNNIFMSSNRKVRKHHDGNTLPSMRTEQKNMANQKYVTNFSQKAMKKNMSYNGINHALMNFSRQPTIPLKQKIKVEKQLKEKSRQNLKLKEQLSKLQKYQEEYNKMKEIFDRFQKDKKYHKSKC